ncbi:hypothetical protein MCOR14_000922 [Pyricularia oryzae]|nr:hypothetical protein MCOR14_000922 [Pyricularia oryzae]
MDPLSIVTASFSFVAGAATASLSVNRFIKDFKERHSNLDDVTTHLETVTGLLDSIGAIVQAMTQLLPRSPAVPAELLKQIPLTITECQTAVSKIQTAIDKFRRDKLWTGAKWSLEGKQQIEEMMKNIERHKITLGIGLIAIQIGVSAETNQDTSAIRETADDLRIGFQALTLEVRALRGDHHGATENLMLQRYLDDVESYATATIYSGSVAVFEDRPATPCARETMDGPRKDEGVGFLLSIARGAERRKTLSKKECVDLDSKLLEINPETSPDHIVELLGLGASPNVDSLDFEGFSWSMAFLLAVVLGDVQAVTHFIDAPGAANPPKSYIFRQCLEIDWDEENIGMDLLRLCEPTLPGSIYNRNIPKVLVAASLIGKKVNPRLISIRDLVRNGMMKKIRSSMKAYDMTQRLEPRAKARVSILEKLLHEQQHFNKGHERRTYPVLDWLLQGTVRHWMRLEDEEACHSRVTMLIKYGAQTMRGADFQVGFGACRGIGIIAATIAARSDRISWLLYHCVPASLYDTNLTGIYCCLAALLGHAQLLEALLRLGPRPAICFHILVSLWSDYNVSLAEATGAARLLRSHGLSPHQLGEFTWFKRPMLPPIGNLHISTQKHRFKQEVSACQLAREISRLSMSALTTITGQKRADSEAATRKQLVRLLDDVPNEG